MEDILTQLQEVFEKSEYLNQKTQSLVEENSNLKQEIRELNDKVKSKDDAIAQLQEKFDTIKLAKSIGGSGSEDAEELKKKINQYIREIDQCLKVLGE